MGSKESCFKYYGSGKYWRRHLNKHGKDLSTEILFETDDLEKFKERGLYYSNLWEVVKSKDWANLCPETGEGSPHTIESKEKIRVALLKHFETNPSAKERLRYINLGKKLSAKTKEKLSKAHRGKIVSKETRQKMSMNHPKLFGKNNPMYGKHHSSETKEKLSRAGKGKIISEETRQKISENHADFSGKNHPMFGKKHSEETKRKMSLAQLKGWKLRSCT